MEIRIVGYLLEHKVGQVSTGDTGASVNSYPAHAILISARPLSEPRPSNDDPIQVAALEHIHVPQRILKDSARERFEGELDDIVDELRLILLCINARARQTH